MLITIEDACDFLKECGDTTIITHQYPDGDCIGAGFGLMHILEFLGKRSRVVCSDEFQQRYDYITACMREYPDFSEKNIITVDLASPSLMGSYLEQYDGRVQLCIDHHISNGLYAKNTLLDKEAAATCEVIYMIAKHLQMPIHADFAAAVYTGIATDTGCFKYENVTSRTHKIASELMDVQKLRYFEINRKMFDVKTPGRFKMESTIIEAIEFMHDGKLAVLSITNEMLSKNGLTINDLDGCSALPLQIEGVEVGATIVERGDRDYKISMRSADLVNVSQICAQFGGGGHRKAAGCTINAPIEIIKKQIIEEVGKVL